MKKTLLLLILFISILTAQNFKQVKVFLNERSDYAKLIESGIDIDHGYFEKDNSVSIFITDDEFEILKSIGFHYQILIDNWDEHFSNRPELTADQKRFFQIESKEDFGVEGFGFGSMGGFYTMDEVYEKLDSMRIQYPNLITQKFSIGTSIEGRPIYVTKISDNPDVDEDEPEVFFNSLIHAREPAAMMGVMYYMYYLLENYGVDPEVTYLVNNREIYFMPVFNVDGYEYNHATNPSGGGMWRKNRRNNGSSYGVDLNRNFGYKWGYDNSGSSGSPSSETYRGTAPFSEPETDAFRDFVESRNFLTGLNYHTYSNLLIIPWGYINQETPDSLIFREYASDMTQFNGYEWGTSGNILYEVNGATDDWMYGEQTTKNKVFTMTPEVGSGSDGFWPSQNRIYPLAQENLFPNLYITWVAGGYVGLTGFEFSSTYINPGDNFTFTPSLRNKGLSAAHNLTIEITSTDDFVTVNSQPIFVDSISSRSQFTPSDQTEVTLSNSAPIGGEINLVVKVFSDGILMTEDTAKATIGTPTFLFEDNHDDPTVLWNIAASPATPAWDATTNSFYSAPSSYTDSKNGDYTNNATVSMTLKDPIDLSNSPAPTLVFWTKYDIEDNWDCGQVQISTNNGATWISLQGNYTVPGSGSGAQPSGQPVYDGLQLSWVKEEISLNQFQSQQVKLRFLLSSDFSITEDGWYVDDIKIFYYGAVPVELVSFSAGQIDNSVALKWSTATELNNSGFEILKSNDKVNWKKIGFKEGRGTTQKRSDYLFTDENPYSGKNFYKLIQIDFDGTAKELDMAEVDFSINLKFALEQNYPNPFNPTTKIKFAIPAVNATHSGQARGLVTLKVLDLLGREVATLLNKPMPAGNYEVEFDASNLPSGVYFYKIAAGSFVETKKMMLIR